MNWELLIPLLATTLIAIIGWIVGHRQNVSRDRAVKHSDLRLQYLIDAYRSLENFAGREPPFAEHHVEALERAIADIQLFGVQRHIDSFNRFYATKQQSGESSLNEMINELRSDLRRELNLLPVDGMVKWLRIDPELIERNPREGRTLRMAGGPDAADGVRVAERQEPPRRPGL